jgi:hypothetical protein
MIVRIHLYYVRHVKTRDYTIMSNHHLRNKNLSLKAKGLLSLILSLPDNWGYTLRGLAAISVEGIDAIRQGITELENQGYIIRERLRDMKGCLRGTEYVIYEQPHLQEVPPVVGFPQEPVQKQPALDTPTVKPPRVGSPVSDCAKTPPHKAANRHKICNPSNECP